MKTPIKELYHILMELADDYRMSSEQSDRRLIDDEAYSFVSTNSRGCSILEKDLRDFYDKIKLKHQRFQENLNQVV